MTSPRELTSLQGYADDTLPVAEAPSKCRLAHAQCAQVQEPTWRLSSRQVFEPTEIVARLAIGVCEHRAISCLDDSPAMGESPRAAFSMPASLKKERKARQLAPTHRFTLDLHESNDKTCPEFSYRELSASKGVKKEVAEPVPPSATDPFGDDNDDEKVKELAMKFEKKYGAPSAKKARKKVGRLEDYIDLGMGYDETDPFIDNTDAYDELVPSTLTTQYGGFYINSGRLDFREVNSASSDDGDSTDDAEVKRKRRRILDKNMKRKRIYDKDDLNPQKQGKKSVELDEGRQRKKQPTVATLLMQYKAQQQTQGAANSVNGASSAANGSDTLPDASNDSESPVSMDDTEGAPKLPDRLPEELEETIRQLKAAALKSAEGKCKFFSAEVNNMLLNIELMSRELSCSERSMVYAHLASHLPCTKETLLKRAKKLRVEQEDTKLKDAVRRLRDAVTHVMPVMELKFKAACQSYDSKLANSVSKKENSDDDEECASEIEEAKGVRVPRRKFEWNEDLRKMLCEVVTIKMRCYEVAKLRSPTAEDYLKQYLDIEIRCLWPKGWMHVKWLIKESQAAHAHLTKPKKPMLPQPRKLSVPGPIQGTVTSVKAVSLLTGQYINSPIISDPQMASAKIVPSTSSFTTVIQPVKAGDDTSKTKPSSSSTITAITSTTSMPSAPVSSPCPPIVTVSAEPLPSVPVAKSEPSVVMVVVTTAAPALTTVSIVSSAPTNTATSTTTTDVGRSNPRVFSYSDQQSQYSSATDVLGDIINATLADFPNSNSAKYNAGKYRDSDLFASIVTKLSHQQSSLIPATKPSASERSTPKATAASVAATKVVVGANTSKGQHGSDLNPSRQHSVLPRVAPTMPPSRRMSPVAVGNVGLAQPKKATTPTGSLNLYMPESKRLSSAKQNLTPPYHSMFNMQEAIERNLQGPCYRLGHATTSTSCPSIAQQSKAKSTTSQSFVSYAAKEGGGVEQPLNFSKTHRHATIHPASMPTSNPKTSSSPVPEVSISIIGQPPDRLATNRMQSPDVLEGLARSFVEQHAKVIKRNCDAGPFSRSGGCDLAGTAHKTPVTAQSRTSVSTSPTVNNSGKSLLQSQQMPPNDPHRISTSQAKPSGWQSSSTMPTSTASVVHFPPKMHQTLSTNKPANRTASAHAPIKLPMDSSSRTSLIQQQMINAANVRAFSHSHNPGFFDPSTYVNAAAALQQAAVSSETHGQSTTALGLPRSVSNVADKMFTPPS